MTGVPAAAPDPLSAQSGTADTVYSDYVRALEAQETARKSSLESRGVNIITTSGTLVTLLFGLVAVLKGSKNFSLPGSAHGYLIAAVILFVSATALGIVINPPLFYEETELTIQDLQTVWSWPAADARAKIAVTQLKTIASARRGNAVKAWLLFVAGVIEFSALLSLFLAVFFILTEK
jgi:hypothetical protein